jgi:hypothetical protein
MEHERIIQSLERIVELQEKILSQLMGQNAGGQNEAANFADKNNSDFLQNLIDIVDVKALLKVSDSTLYRIKRSKMIVPVRIGKRDYYNLSEIKKIAGYFMK